MTLKSIFSITILLLTIIASIVNAADLCSEKADPALKNLKTCKTWQDLRLWYACISGDIMELFIDYPAEMP